METTTPDPTPALTSLIGTHVGFAAAADMWEAAGPDVASADFGALAADWAARKRGEVRAELEALIGTASDAPTRRPASL